MLGLRRASHSAWKQSAQYGPGSSNYAGRNPAVSIQTVRVTRSEKDVCTSSLSSVRAKRCEIKSACFLVALSACRHRVYQGPVGREKLYTIQAKVRAEPHTRGCSALPSFLLECTSKLMVAKYCDSSILHAPTVDDT